MFSKILSYSILLGTIRNFAHGLLLSDLPTPSFVVDMRALQRRTKIHCPELDPCVIPSLHVSPHDCTLFPINMKKTTHAAINSKNSNAPLVQTDMIFDDSTIDDKVGYLHTSVTRSKQEATDGKDDPISTFLAEIDLIPSMCGDASFSPDNNGQSLATLVLGLNNHHVGSYYWARSAGAGAAMDAPGIQYDASDDSRGILRWEKIGGPTDCNTNDGKRSEWANFLRVSDTVQLIPSNSEASLMAFVKDSSFETSRIYGVSSEGRPLGSEPEVVCQWTT
mmetsp:Transcript_18249/g.25712  ORF Transcript_18249/g.25712 Transcript_18249/m.25712 type:complete len:278 (-) Transcript_18249:399-1232(-)